MWEANNLHYTNLFAFMREAINLHCTERLLHGMEINIGVCPRLEFDNIMFNYCLGYYFYINGAFEFLCNSIANLWRHVWYHYNTLGYPVIIISKVIDISCNGVQKCFIK